MEKVAHGKPAYRDIVLWFEFLSRASPRLPVLDQIFLIRILLYRASPRLSRRGPHLSPWLFFTFFRPKKNVSLNQRIWEPKRALETLQGWFWRLHGLPKSVISLHTSLKIQLFYEFASKTLCEPLLARFQVLLSPKIRPKTEPQKGGPRTMVFPQNIVN